MYVQNLKRDSVLNPLLIFNIKDKQIAPINKYCSRVAYVYLKNMNAKITTNIGFIIGKKLSCGSKKPTIRKMPNKCVLNFIITSYLFI